MQVANGAPTCPAPSCPAWRSTSLRRQVQVGQRVRRGAQLHHDRGGLRAVAHRVTDDQRGPAAGQRDDVMPVAADDAGPDRHVAVRDLQPVGHAAAGRAAGPAAAPSAVRRSRSYSRALSMQTAAREASSSASAMSAGVNAGLAGRPREGHAAEHRAPGDERHRQERGEAGRRSPRRRGGARSVRPSRRRAGRTGPGSRPSWPGSAASRCRRRAPRRAAAACR